LKEMDTSTEKKPAARWVLIKTDDGFSFAVERKVALASPTLANSLSEESNFSEAASNSCHIPARGAVGQKVVEYLAHKAQFQNAQAGEDIPDFLDRIPPEIALELLMAADYLET